MKCHLSVSTHLPQGAVERMASSLSFSINFPLISINRVLRPAVPLGNLSLTY